MRRFLQALLATASLGISLSAVAGTPDPAAADTRANRRAEMKQRFFDRIDANHDGSVSRDEYRTWIDNRFERLDANHDGTVDADEVANSPQARERVHKRAERFVRRFDASGSGESDPSRSQAVTYSPGTASGGTRRSIQNRSVSCMAAAT